MSESTMRDALLAQCGTPSVEAELKTLNAIMQAEGHRSQRLTRWSLVVWVGWIACVTAMFALPMLAAQDGPRVAPPAPQNAVVSAMVIVLTGLIVAGAAFLPVIGIVLLILTIFSRRSANISQLRASVAAIDSQLKLLLARGESTRSSQAGGIGDSSPVSKS